MVSNETFRALALSFPEVAEKPHFEKTSFCACQKIFATLSKPEGIANLKLSHADQASFCSISPKNISPVANKWGKQGWTTVNLAQIEPELLYEIVNAAFGSVATRK